VEKKKLRASYWLRGAGLLVRLNTLSFPVWMGWDGTGQIYAHSFSLLIYCRNNTRLLLPAGPTKFKKKKKSKEKKTKFKAKGMEWV
jgi:hypothetical protein